MDIMISTSPNLKKRHQLDNFVWLCKSVCKSIPSDCISYIEKPLRFSAPSIGDIHLPNFVTDFNTTKILFITADRNFSIENYRIPNIGKVRHNFIIKRKRTSSYLRRIEFPTLING